MKIMKTIAGALTLLIVLATTAWGTSNSPFDRLGISSAECDCSFKIDAGGNAQRWVFRAEPRVSGIDRNGPADGVLEPGDYIVAIDGKLIVTASGGRRFSAIEGGEAVVLTIRRDGRVFDERVVPRGSGHRVDISGLEHLRDDRMLELSEQVERLSRMAAEAHSSAQNLQRRARLEALGRDDQLEELERLRGLGDALEGFELDGLGESMRALEADLERLQDAMPAGSFGMGLSFSGDIRTGDDGVTEWLFEDAPVVTTVEFGSPAARAGMKAGDVLTKINGVDLDSREGGERFSRIEPGQTVEFTYERDGAAQTVSLKAVDRPRTKRHFLGNFNRNFNRRDPAQFSMTMGGTRIDVRCDGSVRTIATDNEDVVVIETPDGTFELRRKEKRERD